MSNNLALGLRDRVKEAPWFNPDQSVTIGGLGSIGSWLTLFMGRIINTIYVYDFDKVEEHNLTGQLYGMSHIEMKKDEAVSNVAKIYNPNTTIISRGKFEKGSGVTPICFSGFDNMLARQHMFDSWRSKEDREIFIDGRLTAEQLWVYTVTKENEDLFAKEYMPTDDQVEELPCSFKSTTHISSMIASIMTIAFTSYSLNKKIGEDISNINFETRYIAPLNLFEVK